MGVWWWFLIVFVRLVVSVVGRCCVLFGCCLGLVVFGCGGGI